MVTVGRLQSETYLLRCSHEVDGGVVAVVLLRQAEGELVVDQESIWSDAAGGVGFTKQEEQKPD